MMSQSGACAACRDTAGQHVVPVTEVQELHTVLHLCGLMLKCSAMRIHRAIVHMGVMTPHAMPPFITW